MDTLPHRSLSLGHAMRRTCTRVVAACVPLILLALHSLHAGAQSANDGYRPDANGSVDALIVQPDGKLIVAGAFIGFAGAPGNRLARVNPDGSVDPAFQPNPNGDVRALALQPDGKLYVAGDFGTIGGQARSRLARINPDGTLDDAFEDVNPDDDISALAVQSDGRLIVAGRFDFIGNQHRIYLARFFSSGNIDTSYDPQIPDVDGGWVTSLVLQPDGKLIIGGGFASVGGHPSSHVARLNGDGSVDETFTANGAIAVALALQPDGKVLAGSTSGVYRLNADGSLDAGFDVHAEAVFGVTELALEADGSVLLGGDFNAVNGEVRSGVARVHADGSLDAAFAPQLTSSSGVRALAVQADGKPVIGGVFTAIDGQTLYCLARFYAGGRLDATWNLGGEAPATTDIQAIAVQPDGKWVAGGTFTALGGQPRRYLARVDADGSVDSAFNPDPNNIVEALAVQPDGRVLAGGYFSTIGGVPRNRLARLYADGAVDAGFDPDIDPGDSDASVNALLQQPDGRIVVAGTFATVGGQSRPYLARLDSEGNLDAAFNPNPNDYVYALALQADGKLLVGGVFSTIGAQARNGIARLNADGSLDATYDPHANGGVYALAVQSDGKAVAGGFFTTMGGIGRNRIARIGIDGSLDAAYDPNANDTVQTLVLQTDGKLLAGGWFTGIGGEPRNRIARLGADGGADTGFDADADNVVFGLGLQPDGKVVAGGWFSAIGGEARHRIARLSTREAALLAIDIEGSVVTWTRSGPGAELALPPQLLVSTDGDAYEAVGTMQRTDAGWRYDGFTPPEGEDAFWLRVRGQVRSGFLNGSGGLIESTRIVHPEGNDRIFANGFE